MRLETLNEADYYKEKFKAYKGKRYDVCYWKLVVPKYTYDKAQINFVLKKKDPNVSVYLYGSTSKVQMAGSDILKFETSVVWEDK